MTLFILPFLPEGDKHHQFDAEELAHRPDGSQLFFESSVQQHQTIHGKLERVRERESEMYTYQIPKEAEHIFCVQTLSDLVVA